MKSGHLGQKADTLKKVSASFGRPVEREADTTDRADTFGEPPHTRARFKKTHAQVSAVSVVSASGSTGGSEQADTFSKVSAGVSAALDWSTERPAEGEDAERIAWNIAYLLAGPVSAEEASELARLRRAQRWLAEAPERRAALRAVLVAASAVWLSMNTRPATARPAALILSSRQQRWTLRLAAPCGRGGRI